MGAHFKLTLSHRTAIEDQIESLIAMLDGFDGDSDLEPEEDRCPAADDGCAALFDCRGNRVWGSADEAGGWLKPLYGDDQSAGPINYEAAERERRAAELGLVRSPSGGWRHQK